MYVYTYKKEYLWNSSDLNPSTLYYFDCCVCVYICLCVVEFGGAGESGGGGSSVKTPKLTLTTKLWGWISGYAPALHVILSLCESSGENWPETEQLL